MQTTLVKSSALLTINYDERTKVLEVEFRDRATYRYWEVPEWIHHELLNAESKGAYFNRTIRGAFREKRLQNSSGLS
jgi:hypothetical protein